jgi:hypothetical protein
VKKQAAQKNTGVPPTLKQAKWIWPDDRLWDMHHCFALFRKTFDLKTKPRL